MIPAMDRASRLATIWNWLPAFRAVAETQSLRVAARALHISPSALSRAVRQLEDAIGSELFVRAKSRLHLNSRGEALLSAVRDGMRGVDDALAGGTVRTQIRIACDPCWLPLLVLPIVADGCVVVRDVAASELAGALLQGELDLAIGEATLAHSDLEVTTLATLPRQVFRRRGTSASAPIAMCANPADPWSLAHRHEAVFEAPHLASVIAACCEGQVRAALPVVVGRRYTLTGDRAIDVPPIVINLMRRRALAPDPFAVAVAALRARARKLSG